ncbi:zinc ribbon domain-containing protein [Actinacidiphila oryziradicis]|uniref:NADase-type glycan-binding domain-containing protein n=1 Tax=Actinacidiphila oryziradicis TaxID=2571141 RepID=UPI0023F4AC3D|nr:zinc ribbon domain-containing protein [Actinacidiphila oryziradicis]MCW2872426.1 hypothetical protein [Actinacidiphila oryziradicis]
MSPQASQPPNADPGTESVEGRAPDEICAECGTPPTPGQSFCEGCGAVLRWTPSGTGSSGVTRRSRADRAEETDKVSETARTARTAKLEDAAGTTDAEADTGSTAYARPDTTARTEASRAPNRARGPEPAPAPPVPAPPVPAPADEDAAAYAAAFTSAPTSVAQAPAPADQETDPDADTTPLRGAANDRARALLIPVADPERRTPEAPSVAPVLPGRPIAARPLVQGPAAVPDEGGTPCPWCATGNRPDRHFCRRCAMTLTGRPEDPARRPWWRRLRFFNRPVPWAGERPRLRRGLGRILSWAAGAAALGLLITGAFQIGNATQAVQDHFTKRASVAPDSWRASHSYSGHGAALAFDELNNTWWGPGVAQSGDGEWLEARFQQPTRLLDLIITPGVSTRASDLSQSALPHLIEARITGADGRITTRFITLDRSSGGQRRAFRVGTVSSVRFIIRSAYGAAGNKQVAIAEIEFFGRSNG